MATYFCGRQLSCGTFYSSEDELQQHIKSVHGGTVTRTPISASCRCSVPHLAGDCPSTGKASISWAKADPRLVIGAVSLVFVLVYMGRAGF